MTACSSEHWPASSTDRTAPGRMPQDPAVGAATILPMAALHSEVATARAMASLTKLPQMPPVRA